MKSTKGMMRTNHLNDLILIILTIFLAGGCDFSARMNKQIMLAQEAIKDKNFEHAAAIYERILNGAGSHQGLAQVKIHYQLGEIYSIYLNNPRKAKDHFQVVVNTSNDIFWTVKSLEKIGEISLVQDKDYKTAELVYKKLTSFQPSLVNQDFYEIQLLEALINQSKIEECENKIKLIMTDVGHKYYARAQFLLGKSYFLQSKWPNAIDTWKNYIRMEDSEEYLVEAKFLMGNAYETIGDLKKAYNVYYNIADQYPNRILIKNRLKSIYMRRVSRKR